MLPSWRKRTFISPMFSKWEHLSNRIIYSNVKIKNKRSFFFIICLPLHARRLRSENICDLKQHSGLFSFPCLVAEELDALELLFQLAGKRSVESITWLWNDKTTWSQLGHPDMLETALCLGCQGTKFSVILIQSQSWAWAWILILI